MIDLVTEVVKRPGCRLIRLESGGIFIIPYALFMSRPLKAGESLDPKAYLQALAEIEGRVALEQAARMLEMRDQSVSGLAKKLSGYGYSEETVLFAVSHLNQAGYLDDRRYAEGLIRRYSQKYGAIRIRQELARKGIPKELIHELMDEQDSGQTLQAALKLAQKSMRRRIDDPKPIVRKAYAALARRGFTHDIISKALSQVNIPEDAEDEGRGTD